MRLLTPLELSVAPTAITSFLRGDGKASIVTCTALLALVPWNMESTLMATVIVLQHNVLSGTLALRAVASDANVPKLLCVRQYTE